MAVKLKKNGELDYATGYAVVCNGIVRFDSGASTAESAATLAHGYDVKVVRVKLINDEKRSLSANALLHVWVGILSNETGHDEIETKQMLKIKFGFKVIRQDPVKGEQLGWILKRLGWSELTWPQKVNLCERWIPVTSAMTTKELKQMMDAIKNWARSELGIELPDGKQR